MSRSIDLYSYDYEKLIKKILEVCKIDNRELVEKVLLMCGNKIGDRYIILNQEFWEDFNCYINLQIALEDIFHLDEGIIDDVFCDFDDEIDKQELISIVDLYEIEDLDPEFTEKYD